MALQHFYARVPARASMYNKADGYDTFACSSGIDKELAERELLELCDIKLSVTENDMIRTGGLPPVYTQFIAKNGQLIQSCISYLPLDFTGERCTYMVHSLILSEDEKKNLFGGKESAVLNPELFLNDMSSFNITSPDIKPDREYPEKEYVAGNAESPEWLCRQDPDTVKRYLYTVLASISGKPKSIFISLDSVDQETSDFMCRLVNATQLILPPCMREQISYVTRIINNPSAYPSAKLKGIYMDNNQTIPTAKGAVINFINKNVVGIRDEDVMANIQTVDFMYSLLKNWHMREEFHRFYEYAYERRPALGIPNMKMLSEIIFLFKCGSGMFDEKSILSSDDKILDMFTLYETYRQCIPDEYRINTVKCVGRYAAEGKEIPKKTFAKITKIYPSEIPGTRRLIMNAVLSLIHTDIMREKLFTYIKANYASEETEMKAEIIKHLCSVFYGGFLQTQILEFFMQNYKEAPDESKAEMTDKVLLAIRTRALREQIIAYFDRLYDAFDNDSREKIYDTILEQLPEGDGLAQELVAFVDKHMYEESRPFREFFAEELIEIAESEQRKQEPHLFDLFEGTEGFCSKTIAVKMMSDWCGKKVFAKYINKLCSGQLKTRLDNLLSLNTIVPDITDSSVNKLINAAKAAFEAEPCKCGLEEALNESDRMEKLKNSLADRLVIELVQPIISANLFEVFKANDKKAYRDLDTVLLYCDTHDKMREYKQYEILKNYYGIKKSAMEDNVGKIIYGIDKFPKDKKLRFDIGLTIETDLTADVKKPACVAALLMLSNYLKGIGLSVNTVYAAMMEKPNAEQANSKKKNTEALKTASFAAVDAILEVLNLVETSEGLSDDMRQSLMADNSGINEFVSAVVTEYAKSAISHFEAKLGAKPNPNTLSAEIIETAKKSMPKQSFFGKLFGKK